MPQPSKPTELFYCYARKDEPLRHELDKHLVTLKRRGLATYWYDGEVSPGQEWDKEIKRHLDEASIILLLVSPDFMNSEYCNTVEVPRAMQRHEAGEARVIPILLRHVDWEGAPFSRLLALPSNGQPVTSWPDQDEAFLDIARGIKKAVQELSGPAGGISLPDIPRPPKVGFVPRRDESGRDIVKHLQDELSPHKNQLVALWGAGGVGKTTIAAETARELDDAGRHVVWVTADGRANFTFSTLLDDIAAQFGRTDLRPLALEPKEDAVRALIADASTLLILDNFETISPDEQLHCLNFLAERARCPALITTRESIDAARSIPLRSMQAQEGKDLLDKLIEQTSNPDIYTEANRTRILETAEHNPLVIQWIVGQINLAQGPDEVLSELAHGEGRAAERVFDRSFDLPQMAEGGRAVLLALSLFLPSATRPALAEVSGMGKDKDKKKFKKALQALASLWLLKQTDGGQRVAVEGLTREFARSRLSRDPRSKTFRERFVFKFLRYAQANSKDTVEHLNSIATERENILNAVDIAFEVKDYKSMFRINDAIVGFLDVRGYWDEAIRRGEEALGVARKLGDERWITPLTLNLAIKYQDRNRLGEARQLSDEGLEIAKRLNDQSNIAGALYQLGRLAEEEDNLEEARRLYGEALLIKKRLGDRNGVAGTLHELGVIAAEGGSLEDARQLYEESLEIGKRLGAQKGVASTLQQLGRLAQEEGKLGEARRLYEESLEIEERLGNQEGSAISLYTLGLLTEKEGDKVKAIQLISEALSIFEKLGSRGAEEARKELARLTEEISNEVS